MKHEGQPPVRTEFADPAPPAKSTKKDYTAPIVITVVCLFVGVVVAAVLGVVLYFSASQNMYRREIDLQMRAEQATMETQARAVESARKAEAVMEAADAAAVAGSAGEAAAGEH